MKIIARPNVSETETMSTEWQDSAAHRKDKSQKTSQLFLIDEQRLNREKIESLLLHPEEKKDP